MARSLLLLATLLLSSILLFAPLSTTATNQIKRHPNPSEAAKAMSRMLTYCDVPSGLNIAKGWEFTIKADKSGLKQDLCTVNINVVDLYSV